MRRRSIEDRLGTLPDDWPTDARRVDEHSSGPSTPDPEIERRRRRSRRVTGLVLGLVFVIGLVFSVFGQGGLLAFFRLQGEHDRLALAIGAAETRVESLRADVRALEDGGAARERVARERLGYARRGEMVFILPPPVDTP